MTRATIKSATTLVEGTLILRRYGFEVERFAGGSREVVREVMERGHSAESPMTTRAIPWARSDSAQAQVNRRKA